MPDRFHCPGGGKVSTFEADRRRPPYLCRSGGRIVIGNARQPQQTRRVGFAELCHVVIVELVDHGEELAILQQPVHAEHPIHNLRVNAVEILIFEP